MFYYIGYHYFSAIMVMLSDMLTQCCFSIKISNPTDPNHRFVSVVRKLLHGDHEMPKPTAEIWSCKLCTINKTFEMA